MSKNTLINAIKTYADSIVAKLETAANKNISDAKTLASKAQSTADKAQLAADNAQVDADTARIESVGKVYEYMAIYAESSYELMDSVVLNDRTFYRISQDLEIPDKNKIVSGYYRYRVGSSPVKFYDSDLLVWNDAKTVLTIGRAFVAFESGSQQVYWYPHDYEILDIPAPGVYAHAAIGSTAQSEWSAYDILITTSECVEFIFTDTEDRKHTIPVFDPDEYASLVNANEIQDLTLHQKATARRNIGAAAMCEDITTYTWDGNKTGLDTITWNGLTHYKVSDHIIDFNTITSAESTHYANSSKIEKLYRGTNCYAAGLAIVVTAPGTCVLAVEGSGTTITFTAPSTGVYFYTNLNGYYASDLHITHYGEYASETYVDKAISAFQPDWNASEGEAGYIANKPIVETREALPFLESTTGMINTYDSIVWDTDVSLNENDTYQIIYSIADGGCTGTLECIPVMDESNNRLELRIDIEDGNPDQATYVRIYPKPTGTGFYADASGWGPNVGYGEATIEVNRIATVRSIDESLIPDTIARTEAVTSLATRVDALEGAGGGGTGPLIVGLNGEALDTPFADILAALQAGQAVEVHGDFSGASISVLKAQVYSPSYVIFTGMGVEGALLTITQIQIKNDESIVFGTYSADVTSLM